MSKIEQSKSYTGKELETVFFRPMFSGPDALALGIRVMYNMPVPTTLHFWKPAEDILQKYSRGGWNGATSAKTQRTINLSKVKAEASYAAEDYFSMVYEIMSNRLEVPMDDLSGTELEQAETALFKEAIAESIRATMWLGDTARTDGLNTFDGFLTRIMADMVKAGSQLKTLFVSGETAAEKAEKTLEGLWKKAPRVLKDLKSQGELVFLVTSDIYAGYEDLLDAPALEAAYLAKQQGRPALSYRGIPVVDIQVSGYLESLTSLPQSFGLLTDRRNLALAVNTADFPGTEVKMWYNPDQMENRQRAVFMAGCDYLLPELMAVAFEAPKMDFNRGGVTSAGGQVAVEVSSNIGLIKSIQAVGLNAQNLTTGSNVTLNKTENTYVGVLTGGTGITKVRFTVTYVSGAEEVIVK